MEEQPVDSSREILAEIRNRLTELEDLQLVNKLDIINMKNEMDRMSLTSSPSGEKGAAPADISSLLEKSGAFKSMKSRLDEIGKAPAAASGPAAESVRKDIESLRSQISAIRQAPAKAAAVKESPGMKTKLLALEKRLAGLESSPAKAAAKAGPGAAALSALSKRLDGLEKKPAMPASLLSRISRLEESVKGAKAAAATEKTGPGADALRNDMESLRRDLIVMRSTMQAGKSAKGKPAKLPRIPALDKFITDIGALKKQVRELDVSIDVIEKASPQMTKDVEKSMITIGRLEDQVASIGKQMSAFEKKSAVPPEVAKELKGMKASLDVLSESNPNLASDVRDSMRNISDMKVKLTAIDSRVSGIEKDQTKKPLTASEAKLDQLNEKYDNLRHLFSAIKPIELPHMGGGSAQVEELKKRLDTLETVSGKGVDADRLREIERDMSDIKSVMPKQLDRDMREQLRSIKSDIDGRVHEMKQLRKELIESVIEQMLAQPEIVGRLMDKKLVSRIEEVDKQLEGMKEKSDKTGAEISALGADMEKAKQRISGMEPGGVRSAAQKELEALKPKIDAAIDNIHREKDEAMREFEDMRRAVRSGGASELTSRVSENFEKELRGIREAIVDDRRSFELELKTLESRIDTLSKSAGHGQAGIGDLSRIERDLESMKLKQEWMESNMQKLDTHNLAEKIDELSRKVDSMHGYAPIVIE